MLNPENTRKWIAALRSGDHQQRTGMLEDTEGKRCCLGVACRVAMEDGLPLDVRPTSTGVQFDGDPDVLPSFVRGWLGEGVDADVYLMVPEHVRSECDMDDGWRVAATALNDDFGLTFEQIADCVEATLEAEAAAA